MGADLVKTERPKGSIKVFGKASTFAVGANPSADLSAPNAKRAHIVVDVTDVGGGGTLDVVVLGKDPVSGKYYPILTMTQITATGVVFAKISPGIPVVANVAVDDALPENFRVEATAGTNDVIGSIGINLIDE